MNEIKEGDIVSVNFHGSQFTLCTRGEVLYIPIATGDSWKIRDLATGNIHYISEGCTICKSTQENW